MSQIVYIIFGVSGSGKTTIGEALANDLKIPFHDADDFHPEANIAKMSQGIALNDTDRAPWLATLADQIQQWRQSSGAVLACSALKTAYRRTLESIPSTYIKWIFLDGSFELIAHRMQSRKEHFFKKELLASQFEVLEKPKNGIIIPIDQTVEELISKIKIALHTQKSQMGLVGLGVMGKSIAKNLLSKKHRLSVYNRHLEGKEEDVALKFVAEQLDQTRILGFDDLSSFVTSIQQPRTILLMVNSGKPTDFVIEAILPFLSEGDCLIDGGNSHYKKTIERTDYLATKNIHFLGAGISGGEEGALKGPSIMPSGDKKAYNLSGKFLEDIAAKDQNNNPCCTYLGPKGSGHFVKMIHNGIEYAEMQLLAEIYHLLRFHTKKTPNEISELFNLWGKNGKDSYLLEITAAILTKKEGNHYLIDRILDKAGQKGTGGWSTVSALELGKPLSTISEAVMARNLSALKSERSLAASKYQSEKTVIQIEEKELLERLENAFAITSIINHSIGFDLISEASNTYNWNLNLSEIARIWTNGCIIRSTLMETISSLFSMDNTSSLLLIPEIITIVKSGLPDLQKTVSIAVEAGCPVPTLSSAVNYLLGYISEQSSANIIQAQRDYFGAHTYQRTDKPVTEYFHTNWKNN